MGRDREGWGEIGRDGEEIGRDGEEIGRDGEEETYWQGVRSAWS